MSCGLSTRQHLSFLTTIGLVRVVAAVVFSIADERRQRTKAGAALKASWLTFEFGCFERKSAVHLRLDDQKVQMQRVCIGLYRTVCKVRWKHVQQQKSKTQTHSRWQTSEPRFPSAPVQSKQPSKPQKYTIIIKENREDILECLNFKRSGSERHSRQSAGSSDPSPQSSTVSHFHQKGIHSSVPQRNCWFQGIGKKKAAADDLTLAWAISPLSQI